MIQKLNRQQWQPFFDAMSKVIEGKRVQIETASLKLGDQIQAEWLPLIGITYDRKDNVIEVALDGLDHLIHKPRDVFIDQEGSVLARFEVIDEDGAAQIIKLRDPLMLRRCTEKPLSRQDKATAW
jgi:hypothetical protein